MLDISSLNDAQREAVTAQEGPVLVIAGAGSGKTRTIVYRLAWLVEQGLSARSMLLLTFTRKAAQEMLHRASLLLEQHLGGVQGGTFHGFAFSVLRHYPPDWAKNGLCVMDSADSASALHHCKEHLRIGKGDRTFPKAQTVLSMLSKARNKEMEVEEVLRREAQHLLPHAHDLARLGEAYTAYRREHALLDYDDLLFELERMLVERPDILDMQRARFRQILVDEYQDTNKVQARLVRLLAGEPGTGGNVMAVGDDAQSIYAFRGATVHNILDFPTLFPGTRIVRLEENYRSVQPVLDLANILLEHAPEGYRKKLFSRRESPAEPPVRMYRPLSDLSQGRLAAARVEELLASHQARDIAVLFRAGYQSYHLEVELNKRGIAFRKYGGLRYTEAAHVKDVMAFARLVINPLDLPSFERVSALTKGIGPKTSRKLYEAAAQGHAETLRKAGAKYPDFLADMDMLVDLRGRNPEPAAIINAVLEHYRPRLETLFPDDWPRRWQGLEELSSMAASYDDLSQFIGDLSLESPEEESMEDEARRVTLSTVHSAKGLEWAAVLILDLVEDRFPSRHALARPDDFEEERRLLYVACTRAKDSLDLFVPLSLYSRSSGGVEPATPSPFLRDLPPDFLDEWFEIYGGTLARRKQSPPPILPAQSGQFGSWGNKTRPGPVRRKMEHGADWPDGLGDGDEADRLEGVPDDMSDMPGGGIDPAAKSGYASRQRTWTDRAKPSRDPDAEYLKALAADPHAEQPPGAAKTRPDQLGFCRHKVFGRGKIVESLPPDKYRVNFPGIGLKVILAAYLALE